LKQLFKHVFRELNSRGQFISVLFPIYHPVYEHIGFGLADEHIFYQFRLNNIKPKKYPNRQFKIVESITEDFKKIYTKSTENYNYIARRYESQWDLKSNQADFKVLCHDENMKPVGYCLLKFLKGHYLFKNPSETLHVSEAFWLDKTTKHAIFQDFFYSFRDQRKYGSVVLPINENLIELLIDPVIETRTIKPSSRLRLVNVREVLSKMNYSLKDFNLVVRIHDTYCEWNDNTFIMKSENGNVEMTIDSKNSLVDLEISVSRLAELVVGNRSIYELEEFEDVHVNSDILEVINRLFPKQVNFFRDFF
ncbi:MAG: GNAT family N-acetyltransferase, partial [Candidatus Hodarchaeales archaeon]